MPPERDFAGTIERDTGLMDARWPVAFVSKAAAGDATRSITDVLKYAIDRSEVIQSEGLYTGDEIIFEIPVQASNWSDAVIAPKEGDALTCDGVTYSVLRSKLITWDTVYQVETVKER